MYVHIKSIMLNTSCFCLLYLAIETDIHIDREMRTPSAVAPNEIFNKEILNFI